MRRIALIAAVALAVAIAPQEAAAQDPDLTYACAPTPGDCTGWYRGDVQISWDWDGHLFEPAGGDCSAHWFTADTAGTWASCSVKPLNQSSPIFTGQVLIRVDKTAPNVVSATPSRPPDYGGWFNRPVGFTFAGTDATSGVASCGTAGYGGPDGAGVSIAGSCTDVAGNSATASFPLNYDSTPPAAPAVKAMPENTGAALDWAPATGAERYEVVRRAPGARPATVYAGAAPEYKDRRLRNGVRYRYTVSAIDRAGNRADGSADVVPTSSRLVLPPPNARVSAPPMLAWKPVRRASYYNVQLYRGARKILTRWPRVARLGLKSTWGYQGHRVRLRPGLYEWYVWPGYGRLSARKYGKRLGHSSFRVVR